MSRYLNDWLEGWLEYQENTEPPRQFVKWVAISVIAAALQRKCKLVLGHLTWYPNMYIVLVGPSGSRKGTAMDPGRIMLNWKGIKLSANATTREALIRAIKNSTSSDTDIETGTFNAHHSLTIYSQELTSFMGYNNVQLMSDLTDLYDSQDQWDYDTKDETKKDFISDVWLNLIGATTPETLHAALPMESVGGGFTSRIVFIYGDEKYKVVPIPFLTKEDIETYKKLQHDLAEIQLLRGLFKISDSFIKRYSEWREYNEKNPVFTDPRLGGYLDRRPAHVMKLSMVLSASQSNDMLITQTIFDRALKMIEEPEKQMMRVYEGLGESRDSSVLARVMNDVLMAGGQGCAFPDLMARYYYAADEDMLRRIWRALSTMPQFTVLPDEVTKQQRLYYIGDNEDGTTGTEN